MTRGTATRSGPVPARSAGQAQPRAGSGPVPRGGSRGTGGLVLYLTAGVLVSAVFVVPLMWEVFRSLQPESVVTSAPSASTMTRLTFGNYQTLLSGQGAIVRNVINSLIVAVLTAVLTAVVATLAGYGFACFPFRASGLAFGLVLLALMVPFQAILVPLFVEMHLLHLLNSLAGLALLYTAFNLPFGVYVMRNSFAQVPRDITDAAKVDGATTMGTLLSVLRPLILPGMATTALYAFLFAWTEFLAALTFLTNDNLFTLPVALVNVEAGTYGSINYGLLLSGAVIAMIPCVVVFVALQRYYVRGLISGALKG